MAASPDFPSADAEEPHVTFGMRHTGGPPYVRARHRVVAELHVEWYDVLRAREPLDKITRLPPLGLDLDGYANRRPRARQAG
jgi:hypothetical protein